MIRLFKVVLTVFFLSLIFQANSHAEKLEFSVGVWDGDVKKGKAHGKGTFTFSNGAVYEGKMKKNKFHGKGKLIIGDNIYEGKFRRGNFYQRDKENKKLRKVIELRVEGRFFYERHEVKGTGVTASKWYPAEKSGNDYVLSKKGKQMMDQDTKQAQDAQAGASSGGSAC